MGTRRLYLGVGGGGDEAAMGVGGGGTRETFFFPPLWLLTCAGAPTSSNLAEAAAVGAREEGKWCTTQP
jgi:hypothetical protein